MSNYTDYKILQAEDMSLLEELVNRHLAQGYVLVGQLYNYGCKHCREVAKEITEEDLKQIQSRVAREHIHRKN